MIFSKCKMSFPMIQFTYSHINIWKPTITEWMLHAKQIPLQNIYLSNKKKVHNFMRNIFKTQLFKLLSPSPPLIKIKPHTLTKSLLPLQTPSNPRYRIQPATKLKYI